MADKNKDKAKRLERRQFSVRNSVFGTAERPRLSVYRSSKHIYAQIIDDYTGKTLAAAATTQDDVRGEKKTGANLVSAKNVGRAIAEKAKAAGVTLVVFDRGGGRHQGPRQAPAAAGPPAGVGILKITAPAQGAV